MWSNEEIADIQNLKTVGIEYFKRVFKEYRSFGLDECFTQLILDRNKWFITGGVVSSIYHKQPVNDLDIFFTDIDYANGVREYLEKRPEFLMAADANPNADYKEFFGTTDIAVTLKRVDVYSDGMTRPADPVCIQFICPRPMQNISRGRQVIGDPESVTAEFDMHHVKSYFHGDKFFISPKTYRCMKSKIISIPQSIERDDWNIDDQKMIEKRLTKWQSRGYELDAVSNLRLDNLRAYREVNETMVGWNATTAPPTASLGPGRLVVPTQTHPWAISTTTQC